jgi:hypothetical protein
MLMLDLPQTWCALRCRVKSSCSGPGDMCVCSVLCTDFYFQVCQARRRYTILFTGALVNQLIQRLIKYPDYPQPPKGGTSATVQFTRISLIRPSCSSHRLEARYSDRHGHGTQDTIFLRALMGKYYALLRMRPLSISCAEGFLLIS